MLLGHRVRLIDAFRVFDANNSKKLGSASKHGSQSFLMYNPGPGTPLTVGLLLLSAKVSKRWSCIWILRRRR